MQHQFLGIRPQFTFPHRQQVRLALGAALLTAGLLAGCGGSDDATPTPAPTDAPAAAAAPTNTPEAAPTNTTEPAPTDTPAPTTAPETKPVTETQTMTETGSMTETEGMTQTTGADLAGQDMAEVVTLSVTDDAQLGSILVDQEEMTLYLFDKDEADKSHCTGDCLEKWPPVLVENMDSVAGGSDVLTGEVGAIEVGDGMYQATYAGHPLYYYAQDAKPGDVNGQGVGEVWWVLGADGQAIGK